MTLPCPHVLCYGHDEMLLYTRKQILDREFVAEKCGTLAGLTEMLSRGPLDLVVICQSVSDAECASHRDGARSLTGDESARHAGRSFGIVLRAFRCGDGKPGGPSSFAGTDPRNARNCCPSKPASGLNQRQVRVNPFRHRGVVSHDRAAGPHSHQP
jgi:hypothetical protein